MIDRADGRAVLTAMFQQVDAAVGKATRGRWSCRRAVPRIDGSLYFEMVCGAEVFRLEWLGPGVLEFPAGTGRGTVVQTVERTLMELLATEDFVLLRHCNQDRASLRFDDDVVDVLLAGRFEPGRTSWFGYRFVDAFQETSEAFYVTFHGPRGPVVFWVCSAAAAASAGGELLYASRLFELRLIDDRRDPGSRRLLSHQVERFLGFLLNRAVHPGMTLEAASAADQAGEGDMLDVPFDRDSPDSGPGPVSTSRWGNPRQWYQFFSDFEIERSNLCSLAFSDPVSRIVHGEPECRNIEPQVFGRAVTYANLPWHQEPRSWPAEGSAEPQEFFTGLGEEDLVLGGIPKLERALAAATSSSRACMVCVNDTCLPKIIGDDVRSAIARYQRSSDIPIYHLNTDLGSPHAAFLNLVEQARRCLKSSPDSSGGRGLNLIGFHPGRARDELIEELEQASIPVNVCLMPEFGIESLRRYQQGAAGIVYPYSLWLGLAENILRDLGVPWTVPPAPYGLNRTREWFRSAAAEVSGDYPAWEARWPEEMQDHWERLTAQAGEHGLAVVVAEDSLARLVDSSWHYGFELLPLLEEMGFTLQVLVKQRRSEKAPDSRVLLEALTRPARHSVTAFSTPQDLAELLRSGSFSAVYSEVFFDTRITRAGKAQFNLAMFEMGRRGALRSLRRLLNVCRWPFYRRYGRHLAAAAERANT